MCRLLNSPTLRYGRPATILPASGRVIPGSVCNSLWLAELMSMASLLSLL